ncbi:hypothetical protein H4R33_006132 [Dimargaris cristalligena]|nr:hypothetical protein H4R33_006132 [Dimargaris cristalligena]
MPGSWFEDETDTESVLSEPTVNDSTNTNNSDTPSSSSYSFSAFFQQPPSSLNQPLSQIAQAQSLISQTSGRQSPDDTELPSVALTANTGPLQLKQSQPLRLAPQQALFPNGDGEDASMQTSETPTTDPSSSRTPSNPNVSSSGKKLFIGTESEGDDEHRRDSDSTNYATDGWERLNHAWPWSTAQGSKLNTNIYEGTENQGPGNSFSSTTYEKSGDPNLEPETGAAFDRQNHPKVQQQLNDQPTNPQFPQLDHSYSEAQDPKIDRARRLFDYLRSIWPVQKIEQFYRKISGTGERVKQA